MKIIFTITGLCFLLLITSCCTTKKSKNKITKKDTKIENSSNYLGSECKGNYVWGGAMNLAWNELTENVLHEKLQLKTDDSNALEMISKLNNAPFAKNDLDEASYYIKSGYGQETVVQINRESRAKFPSKKISDLEIKLKPKDIISYAYFLKEVEYKTMFKKKDVTFNGQTVKGFVAAKRKQKDNIKILKYDSDDKFIIKLQLKENADELILAKGYNRTNPQAVVDSINKNNFAELPKMNDADLFAAPIIHLNYHRDYVELINKSLANKGFEEYILSQMFENIKFDMDEKGARVENEAVIAITRTAMLIRPDTRNFILNKPYWIVMKRADSQHPYFILRINNTGLMVAE